MVTAFWYMARLCFLPTYWTRRCHGSSNMCKKHRRAMYQKAVTMFYIHTKLRSHKRESWRTTLAESWVVALGTSAALPFKSHRESGLAFNEKKCTTVNRGDFEHFWQLSLYHKKLWYSTLFCVSIFSICTVPLQESVQSHPKVFKVTPLFKVTPVYSISSTISV